MNPSLMDHVTTYVADIGKDPKELLEVRVKEKPERLNDPLIWKIELVFNNGTHDCVRVAKIRADGEFRSLTAETRLHVPAGEVPAGSLFCTARGEGPMVRCLNGDDSLVWGYPVNGSIERFGIFRRDELVECAIYLSKDGVRVGEQLVLPLESLEAAGYSPEKLVGGCKFDFFGLTRKLAYGLDSVRYPEDEEQYHAH